MSTKFPCPLLWWRNISLSSPLLSSLSGLFLFLGAGQFNGKAGAHLPCEPSPDGPGPGPGFRPLLQGGAYTEHGPCGQGDHHGGAADLQAPQEAGMCVTPLHVPLLMIWSADEIES